MSVTAGGPVSLKALEAKFYVRLQLIRSVLRASKFSVLKYIEIVILCVYYIESLLTSASFWYFCDISFQLFKLLCLTKNHWWWFCTRNAHMVLLYNEIRFKMVNTSWYLFLFQPLHSLGECQCWWTREHMYPSSTVDFSWFEAFREHRHFRVEIHWNCNFWGLSTIPFGFILFGTFVISLFNFLATLFG